MMIVMVVFMSQSRDKNHAKGNVVECNKYQPKKEDKDTSTNQIGKPLNKKRRGKGRTKDLINVRYYPKWGKIHQRIKRNMRRSAHKNYKNIVKCPNIDNTPRVGWNNRKIVIIAKIGIWNTILATSVIMLAAILYQTPIERQALENDTRRYIPKWKRWNYINWLKRNVKLTFSKWFNRIEKMVECGNTKYQNRAKLRKIRIAAKAHRQPRKVTNLMPIMAMAALAMNSQTEIQASQRITTYDTDSKIIGVDNRCSACISNDPSDFISELRQCGRSIKGFGGSRTTGVMVGTLKWSWCDDKGKPHSFIIPNSYYVKDSDSRLLSPQHWAKSMNDKSHQGTGEFTSSRTCTLYWNKRKNTLTIPLTNNTNVANIHMTPGYRGYAQYCQQAEVEDNADADKCIIIAHTAQIEAREYNKTVAHPVPRTGSDAKAWQQLENPQLCDFDLNGPTSSQVPNPKRETNHNEVMSRTSHNMLKLHQRMGHIPFRKLQLLAKEGSIPREYANCDIPVCTSCEYAKMSKRPWRGKPSSREPHITRRLEPGEVVSVDQLTSPTHGFIAQMTGILTAERYKYATVYVDQASRLGYIYLQKKASAEETIKGKMAFELWARENGVKIKAYHADNGIFRAKAWINHCNLRDQNMTFAGVNAHHQNGIAERRIREVQDMARTMLIHAAHRWPNCITANLWPYAIRMANEAVNNCPSLQDETRRSPLQIFTKSKVAMNPKHFQTFGCPVYVLDNDLQQNAPFHKWKERSRVGIYLGTSPRHGRNVAMVLNRQTGLVSPQFHVKFDPSFHSVMQDTFESKWQEKAGFTDEKNQPTTNQKPTIRINKKRKQLQQENPDMPSEEGGTLDQETGTRTPTRHGKKMPNSEGARHERDHITDKSPSEAAATNRGKTRQPNKRKRLKTSRSMRQGSEDTLKTSNRSDEGMVTPSGVEPMENTQIPTQNNNAGKPHGLNLIAMTTEIINSTKDGVMGELMCFEALHPDGENEYKLMEMEENPLVAYKATSDPDTMYHHEAMREPDKEEFKKAMVKEVTDQMKNGNFTIVHISNVPKDKTVLPAVWQMKRKRDIKTRKVKKYKARLNIDGSRMKKGIHYNETYAPVASWKSIRLLLIMVAKYGWYSKQLDYVLAFPQAPVEKEIYMKIPKGFKMEGKYNSEEYVLKLHRNVYGQKQAGRVWNQYLVDKLVNQLKFKQSKIDECVFYRGKTMYVLYTDDSLLAGPDMDEIDQIVKDLKKAKLDITDEGDIQDFLGVNISMKKDGTIHLTQPHLVDQIISDLGLSQDNVRVKSTPAMSSNILRRDEDGEDFDKSFNYRSVVGKLNYLEKGTRSDIAYITHQCARFTESPKESHAKALRWLGRYLKGTRDKGLILKPGNGKGLQVHVDADFSGNWDPKSPQKDRDTARSRHGYIVSYEGSPLLWKSQLQGEIALSSTESEYIGISYALREVIPVMELLKEMKALKFPIKGTTPAVHCKVFEDNSGAMEMAKTHKYRPRTKHLNVKLHHFRDYVTRGEISIHKIDTKEQLADYLTKPVKQEILEYLRHKVMGW